MHWWLYARNHKRRELNCVSSANVEILRYSEKKTTISRYRETSGQIGLKSEFYCYTHLLTHLDDICGSASSRWQ